MSSHGLVANFLKLKRHWKLYILCSGKDQRFLGGITGLTNCFYQRETVHATHEKVFENKNY